MMDTSLLNCRIAIPNFLLFKVNELKSVISEETGSLVKLVECLLMIQETGVQSQVWVIPKTLKMVVDTSLLNIQHYKVRIKGKVEQFRESSSPLPYTSV